MDEKRALNLARQIMLGIFGKTPKWTLEEILEKFAFDVKLPVRVYDSTTGEETWAESMNSTRYITQKNEQRRENWMLEKRDIDSIEDIIGIWRETNYTTTERNFNSVLVGQSDTVYGSESVWRSANCGRSKGVIFCDGCFDSEFILGSQRSTALSFCMRVDDSGNSTKSYNVVCSSRISNCFFIQDSSSLHECMFCSHLNNKRYCIANMQFEKEEYFAIKKMVIRWILSH